MTFKIVETDGGYVKVTGKRDGEKIGKMVLLEQELPELIEAIKQYQNPQFVKGDIVILSGADWASSGLHYTYQVIDRMNVFEHDRLEYQIFNDEGGDFSARLIGRVIE